MRQHTLIGVKWTLPPRGKVSVEFICSCTSCNWSGYLLARKLGILQIHADVGRILVTWLSIAIISRYMLVNIIRLFISSQGGDILVVDTIDGRDF